MLSEDIFPATFFHLQINNATDSFQQIFKNIFFITIETFDKKINILNIFID